MYPGGDLESIEHYARSTVEKSTQKRRGDGVNEGDDRFMGPSSGAGENASTLHRPSNGKNIISGRENKF